MSRAGDLLKQIPLNESMLSINSADVTLISTLPPSNGGDAAPDETLDDASETLDDLINDNSEGEAIGSNDSPERQAENTEEDKDAPDTEEDEDLEAEDAFDDLKENSSQVSDAIEEQEKGISSSVSGGDISLSNAVDIRNTALMRLIDNWVSRLKGKRGKPREVYAMDVFSRKVKGLPGRDVERPNKKAKAGEKLILFMFDTSGSMNRPLMASVCNDLSLKLARGGVITKMVLSNLNGTVPFVISSVKDGKVKLKIKKALRKGTLSDLNPGMKRLNKDLTSNIGDIKKISGIVLVTDFYIDNMQALKLFINKWGQIPVLGLGVDAYPKKVTEMYQKNSGVKKLDVIMVHGNKAVMYKPMKR